MGAFSNTMFGPLGAQEEEDPLKPKSEVTPSEQKKSEVESSPLWQALADDLVNESLRTERDPAEIAEEKYQGMGLGQKLLKGFLVGGIPGAVLGGARVALVKKEMQKAEFKKKKLQNQINIANALSNMAQSTKRPPAPLGEITKALNDFDTTIGSLVESGSVKQEEVTELRRRVALKAAGVLPQDDKESVDEAMFKSLTPDQKVQAAAKKFLPETKKEEFTDEEFLKMPVLQQQIAAKERELGRKLSAEEIGQMSAREAALHRQPKQETIAAVQRIPTGTDLGHFSQRAVTVLSPNLGKDELANTAEGLRIATETNDFGLAKQTVQNAAIASAGAGSESAKTYSLRLPVINEAVSLKKALAEFEAAGGSMSLLNGSVEEMQNKLGQVGDPKLAGIAQRLKFQLMQFVRQQSGVAFSPQEMANYESVFPTSKKSFALNSVLMDNLISRYMSEQRAFLQLHLGDDTTKFFFGSPGAQSPISDDILRKHNVRK